jgi:hypothetical protein
MSVLPRELVWLILLGTMLFACPAWAGEPAEEDEVLHNANRLPTEWPARLRHRICWLSRTRFENDDVLEEAKEYLRRAKAAGYTAVVLGNSKWLALPSAWGEDYQRRLRDIGKEARKLGLELIPYVTNFGSGGSLLSHDPHLAEGMPVRDALFVVQGREATVPARQSRSAIPVSSMLKETASVTGPSRWGNKMSACLSTPTYSTTGHVRFGWRISDRGKRRDAAAWFNGLI